MLERYGGWPRRDAASRYLVIASLPHMPRFDRARRLPIGRETLAARLALLPAADAEEIDLATSFLHWQRHPAERTDEEVIRQFERIMNEARTPELRRLIATRLDIRTLVAALRRRRLGKPPPRPGERWGVGSWVRIVERRYTEPDFGLQYVVPWLPTARHMLEAGDPVALERLLFGLVWAELDRLACGDRFGVGALLAYVFKWDLVDRSLRRNAAMAARRLDALASEALDGHAHPLAAGA